MGKTENNSAPGRLRVGRWLYLLLLFLFAIGFIYVLVARRTNGDASASPRTPLGETAITFIQQTLRASASSPAFPPLALTAAFLLGGLHALTPGHNKTLTGAYLVGAHGRLRHAVLIGTATAFSHTASVTVIAILALSTAGQITSVQYLRWVGLPSGALTMILGVWLLRRHFGAGSTDSHPHDHDHSHEHEHTHSSQNHSHVHLGPDRVTLGELVALGLSHGIVPTLDALAILLVALNVSQPILGVGLVLAYSLGIAIVLIGIGIIFIHTQELLRRQPRFERISRQVPALAAIVVILLGLWLIARTLVPLIVQAQI